MTTTVEDLDIDSLTSSTLAETEPETAGAAPSIKKKRAVDLDSLIVATSGPAPPPIGAHSAKDKPEVRNVPTSSGGGKSRVAQLKPRPLSTKHILAPDRIIMLGACESGKSSLIRALIRKYYEHPDMNILRCYWFGTNHDSEKWIPKTQRGPEINQPLHDSICEVMKEIKKRDENKYIIIVWDDILGEAFHKDKWFTSFISVCRHWNIILLIGLQYMKAISPVIRENVQNIYLTSANNRTLDALFELSQADYKKQEWIAEARRGLEKACSTKLDFRAGAREILHITTDYTPPKAMRDLKA